MDKHQPSLSIQDIPQYKWHFPSTQIIILCTIVVLFICHGFLFEFLNDKKFDLLNIGEHPGRDDIFLALWANTLLLTGLKEKLAPEAIKALEQGLKDAREAKAAWQAVMLCLASAIKQ